MKNLTFLKLFVTTMFVMATALFAGCVDDNDDTEAPRLEVSPKTLVFDTDGTPVEGSQSYFEISATRHWTATVLDDKTWVTLSKMEGDGSDKVQVSIPEGITDEAKVLIQISNKVGVLMKEEVTIRSGNIVPAVVKYLKLLADSASVMKSIDSDICTCAETELLKKLSALLTDFTKKIDVLDKAVVGAKDYTDVQELANYYRNSVFAAMQELRAVADEMESNMSAEYWPYPSYGKLLFSV